MHLIASLVFYLHTVGSDYTGVVQRLLTFDMNNSEFPIPIDIHDDDIHELDENFFGTLSTGDVDAILEPGQTIVRIQNDDGMVRVYRKFCKISSLLLRDYSCDIHLPSTGVHVPGKCWYGKSVCRQDW